MIPTIIENKMESQSNSPIKSKSHKKNNSSELTQPSTFSGIMKLAERIQRNNQKTSQENIKKVLVSSKKKEKSLSVKEKNEMNFENSNNNDSFNALPYTKNFKKKKLEEVNTSFPLKKIKFADENSNSLSINVNNNVSQKQQTFISKRKFKINKENDAIQLSQNEQVLANKENFFKKIENNCNNNNINDENLFRQNFRKKEDRKNLSGFSCDQCEKVKFFIDYIIGIKEFYYKNIVL